MNQTRQQRADERYRQRHPERWRQIQRDSQRRRFAAMTPAELEQFRKDKAAYDKAYREKHRERRIQQRRDYCAIPEKHAHKIAKMREWYDKNRRRPRKILSEEERTERRRASFRKYGKANRRKQRAHYHHRMKTQPEFRLKLAVRAYLYSHLGRKRKADGSRFRKLIGCTAAELKAHIERQFEPWMNWGLYGLGEGKFVIDHIRPIASFNLLDEAQLMLCFHFTNLRPLAWRENMLKSDKLLSLS